jgi:CRISPR-associated exonuclease Cas4
MFSLTPSHVIQYLYCPRFTYFEYVLRIPQYEEKEQKVLMGRSVHEDKADQNKDYIRKRIGVVKKQTEVYLTNRLLRGQVDEVLTLKDGTMAPLDYKFAKWEDKLYETYRTQLFCYAWLIAENYGVKVNKGFLVYTRSKNYLLEVPILEGDVNKVVQSASAIEEILKCNAFPPATKVKTRCAHCTYRNVCPQ